MNLGERLRALRKQRGLTQDQLASAAGLDRVVVVQIETGRNQVSTYSLRRGLAKALGYSVERLSEYLDGELELSELLTGTSVEARTVAAALAREDGVAEAAIRSVLAEPVDLTAPKRSTLWWALRMKMREAHLLTPDEATAAGQTTRRTK